jgi:hypothetical protein
MGSIHGITKHNFDFALTAKNSLGSAYDSLGGGQRQEFTRTFCYLLTGSASCMITRPMRADHPQQVFRIPLEYNGETRRALK